MIILTGERSGYCSPVSIDHLRPPGLFPRMGFIVTILEADSRAVVRFYNKRGTAEQWIKAGKEAGCVRSHLEASTDVDD